MRQSMMRMPLDGLEPREVVMAAVFDAAAILHPTG